MFQLKNRCNGIFVPFAKTAREATERYALQNTVDKINEATQNGEVQCYIAADNGGLPKAVVQRIIDAGYDVIFSHYSCASNWFIEARWIDGCNGSIFQKNIGAPDREVTIEEMFSEVQQTAI